MRLPRLANRATCLLCHCSLASPYAPCWMATLTFNMIAILFIDEEVSRQCACLARGRYKTACRCARSESLLGDRFEERCWSREGGYRIRRFRMQFHVCLHARDDGCAFYRAVHSNVERSCMFAAIVSPLVSKECITCGKEKSNPSCPLMSAASADGRKSAAKT